MPGWRAEDGGSENKAAVGFDTHAREEGGNWELGRVRSEVPKGFGLIAPSDKKRDFSLGQMSTLDRIKT